MCGRFVRHSSLSLIEKTFNIDSVEAEAASSYNIAPTQKVLAVIRNGKRRLTNLHWGLVPFWAKDRSIGSRLINARAETVAEKPSFRNAFKKRRCLIVADGFYEWKGEKGNKQPYYLTLPSGGPFAFAGLWEIWQGDGADYHSCSIITTAATESVRNLHHRMPVILRPQSHDAWLDTTNPDAEQLKQILRHGFYRKLDHYAVAKRVNAVKNNDPACIEPLDSHRQ
jgi:putative SOS response-associated peptidase YedK